MDGADDRCSNFQDATGLSPTLETVAYEEVRAANHQADRDQAAHDLERERAIGRVERALWYACAHAVARLAPSIDSALIFRLLEDLRQLREGRPEP
jgi:hypothetical protein